MLTNAVTKAGRASGSISAQSNSLRPGKSHAAVSQARLTPSSTVPTATPSTSQNVLINNSTKTVSTRCRQTPLAGENTEERTIPKGAKTRAAIRKVASCQRSSLGYLAGAILSALIDFLKYALNEPLIKECFKLFVSDTIH